MASRAERKGRQLPGLKAAREQKFITQKELADRAGMSQASVWQLETLGRGAYVVTIRKLAEALEVKPEVLVEEPNRAKELTTSA